MNNDFNVTLQFRLKLILSGNSMVNSVAVLLVYKRFDIGHEESRNILNVFFIFYGFVSTADNKSFLVLKYDGF